MPFAISGKIDGLADLLSRLDGLEKKVRKKTSRQAAAAAGKIVLRESKALVRIGETGLLEKSLGTKIKVYKGAAVAIVGPRTGFKTVGRGQASKRVITKLGEEFKAAEVNPIKYAHLVELGTKGHGYKTRGGEHPGSQPYPFLRPALENNRAKIMEAMAEIFRAALGDASP